MSQNEYKIMVVDDELPIGMYVKKALEKNEESFSVTYMEDPVKACADFSENIYDLFVVDLKMPGMTGFEVGEKIRNISRYKDVPIVVYSSTESKEDKERALAKPVLADGFVSKSDDSIEFLVHQIRSIFWRKKAEMMSARVDTAKQLGLTIGNTTALAMSAVSAFSEILNKDFMKEKFNLEKAEKFLNTIGKNTEKVMRMSDYLRNIKAGEFNHPEVEDE